MFELFKALSSYNKNVNSIISNFILNLTEEQFYEKIKSYYPSIMDNFLHVMDSDVKWLHRLSRFYKSSFDENQYKEFKEMIGNKPILFFNNKSQLIEFRNRIDIEIQNLILSLKSVDLSNIINIEFGKSTLETEIWKMLLQWLNHQTHHRGQISIQLEMLGIENDYSFILNKI